MGRGKLVLIGGGCCFSALEGTTSSVTPSIETVCRWDGAMSYFLFLGPAVGFGGGGSVSPPAILLSASVASFAHSGLSFPFLA